MSTIILISIYYVNIFVFGAVQYVFARRGAGCSLALLRSLRDQFHSSLAVMPRYEYVFGLGYSCVVFGWMTVIAQSTPQVCCPRSVVTALISP